MVPLSFQPQPNHECGPPGPKTDVLGLAVACHPAQQPPLPKQEETQGVISWREHQAKTWRVSQMSGRAVILCAPLLLLFTCLTAGSYFLSALKTDCSFRMPLNCARIVGVDAFH